MRNLQGQVIIGLGLLYGLVGTLYWHHKATAIILWITAVMWVINGLTEMMKGNR